MDEAGVQGFRSDTWNALAAPPKTPAAIVAKLNAAINEVLKTPETVEHMRRMNMTPVGGTPDAIKAFIKDETERWGEVIRAAQDQRGLRLAAGGSRSCHAALGRG